ncbi:hypothetical protein HPT27_09770 [Permianibacter sp. IMCC34836]|uniref:hypothetical protein n=1 Tax=Permianibacter fluminis TaxID=2738515 RepID=UPI001554C3B6|nr:hypothetical protein [Permianibacter fluminis]NQD37315.1 hypothetical protein [Permianibacter fluminis]
MRLSKRLRQRWPNGIAAGALIFLAANTITAADERPTCDDRSFREIIGPATIAGPLYQKAQAIAGLTWKDGEFERESFTYIGPVRSENGNLHVTHVATVWGPSCRQTDRLVLWNANLQYIGHYYGVQMPLRIEGSRLCAGNPGSQSCASFDNGIPQQLLLEGESFDLSATK